MKNYLVRLMNKGEVMITEKEMMSLKDKEGLVYIPSRDRVINTHSIADIISEDDLAAERRRGNSEGILHDGRPVIKYFGNWYLKGEMIEERGKMVPAILVDPSYYREVAMDCVPSAEDYYLKFAKIADKTERLKTICGKDYELKRLGEGGLQKISLADKYRAKE